MADRTIREYAIQSAIKDFESGVYSTQSAAAKAYNVPRTTLASRLKGCTNARVGHEQQQRLTLGQEEFLADWISSVAHSSTRNGCLHPPYERRDRAAWQEMDI
ncbi:hypothetical protein VE03_06018 [Pseudogymnoascus sp. 23342-1-I1]|nr:hypothetical protein VE03_06018 [Pseudogymnoascus sp. 23342-1-I1]